MSAGMKNWCGIEGCDGHPDAGERHLVDMVSGRYICCGTDAMRPDAFHAAGCPNAPHRTRGDEPVSGCQTCWDTAYRIARWGGRSQAEVYAELLKAQPSDGSHSDSELGKATQ